MRKNRTRFLVGLIVVLCILLTSVVSGYFIIDKILVPKYFGMYNINNLSELVEIVQTIYVVPNEKDFITKPYSDFDGKNATQKLKTAGFPVLSTGEIDYESIANHDYTRSPDENFVDPFVLLTDREVASIAGDIIESGLLVSKFPDLSYINTLSIELKQLVITPDKDTSVDYEIDKEKELDENSKEDKIKSTTDNANILVTLKLDTESSRKQIATNLNMPQFLVDWIIPDTIYVTSKMDTRIDEVTNERVYENASLSINSKTAKQSEVLLNLLISFIFPEDTFTIESFANQLCSLAIEGINLLGSMDFLTFTNSDTGIRLYV